METEQSGQVTEHEPSSRSPRGAEGDETQQQQPGGNALAGEQDQDVSMTDATAPGHAPKDGYDGGGGGGAEGEEGGSVSGGGGDEEPVEEDNDLSLQNDIRAQVEGEEKEQRELASGERPDGAVDNNNDAVPPQQADEQPQATTAEKTSSSIAVAAAAAPASSAAAAATTSDPSFIPPELDRCSIYDIPPNVARIRQLLFELREPIEMSVDEFAAYWPFIDNIWVKHRPGSTRQGTHMTDYYMCRLRRATSRSKQEKTPAVEGKKPRQKAVREGGTCNVQMKIVKFEGAVTTITISRTPNSSLTHSHDLDHMDNVKRNSGLMGVIWKEAEKAYQPASIFAKFREDPVRLAAAGGKFLRASDVRNVSAKWRASHPNVQLRTHPGYQVVHGSGVKLDRGQQGAAGTAAGGVGSSPRSGQAAGPAVAGDAQRGAPPQQVEAQSALPTDALPFPGYSLQFLEPYLPQDTGYRKYPHVTLTYASSMDSKISLLQGIQTALSGHESKLMTHYLRSRHDAVLIGVRTAVADDPSLNCRLTGAGGYGGIGRLWQPRPIIVDPTGKWPVSADSKLMKIAKEGRGKAPWVVVSPGAVVPADRVALLKSYGGDFLRIVDYNAFWRLRWEAMLAALAAEGIRSVMIEGGATVISELLNPEYSAFVDSLIVTVAPTFLGKKGLGVAPDSRYDESGKPVTAMAPREVRWQPMGQDVIMCGKIRLPPPPPPPPPPQPAPGLAVGRGGQPQASAAPAAPPILEGIEAVAKGE